MDENTLNVGALEEAVVEPVQPVQEVPQEVPAVEEVEIIHEDAEGNVIPPAGEEVVEPVEVVESKEVL